MSVTRDPHQIPAHLQSEFDHLSAHIEQMWGRLLRGSPHQPRFGPTVLEPPVDVYQTATAVVVLVEIPGIRDQEVRLQIEPTRITIRGAKGSRHPAGDHLYSQMEIACGVFERTVQLPADIDPDGAAVKYDDGYLEIRLPRLARRSERHVRITVRSAQ